MLSMMTDFIATHAVALAAFAGGLLVACSSLLVVIFLRRSHQRNAVMRLIELVDEEARLGRDAAMSGLVHDLNNILLALSMESERLAASEATDSLQQVIAEGKELVERCRAQTMTVDATACDLPRELRAAARLVSDAGLSDVDVRISAAVHEAAMVAVPSTYVHLLVLCMIRAVGAGGAAGRPSLTVTRGRDATLPADDYERGWVTVSAVCSASCPEDDAAALVLSRIAMRFSGDVASRDPAGGRPRIAVSLPVIDARDALPRSGQYVTRES